MGEMLVKVFDLVEAEGRSLQHNAVKTVAKAMVVVAVALLALGGVGLLAAAAFMALASAVGAAGAAAITGGVVLVLAIMLGLVMPWLLR